MKKLLALLFAIFFGLSSNIIESQDISQKSFYVDPSKMRFMKFDRYGSNTRMITFLYENGTEGDDSKFIYHVKESPYPMAVYTDFFNSVSSGDSTNAKLQVDSTKLSNIIFGTEGSQRILLLGYDNDLDGVEDARFAYSVSNTAEYNIMKTQLVRYYLDLNNNHELEKNEVFSFNK